MIDLDSLYQSPVEIAETIAENARKRRKALKLSQKELSNRSGVSYASIRRFEDTGKISLESLLALALVLEEKDSFKALFAAPVYKTMEDFLNG